MLSCPASRPAAWRVGAALVVLLLGVSRQGDRLPGAEPAALPADLALVPPQATGFVTVRLADAWDLHAVRDVRPALAKLTGIEKAIGSAPAAVERLTALLLDTIPGSEPLLVVATHTPYAPRKVLDVLAPGAREETVPAGSLHVTPRGRAVLLVKDRVYVVGPEAGVRQLLMAREGKVAGPLTGARALAAQKHLLTVGVNVQRIAEVAGNDVPPQAAPFVPLLRTQLGTLTLDMADALRVRLELTFPTEATAQAGEGSLRVLLQQARQGLAQSERQMAGRADAAGLVSLIKQLRPDLDRVVPKRSGTTLQLGLDTQLDAAVAVKVLTEAVETVRHSANRARNMNCLKQLALAMHNYHDKHGRFPPSAVFGKDGKPLLSWRVLLLPYLGEDELYNQFRLDEPWDSPHNLKLLDRMPAVLASPQPMAKPAPVTPYQVFTGKGTVFEGRRGVGLAEITDGTSYTLLLVEGTEPVPWTKPADLAYAADQPLPRLGAPSTGGFLAAFCDGSVRFFPSTLKEATLRSLITRGGNEVVDLNNQ